MMLEITVRKLIEMDNEIIRKIRDYDKLSSIKNSIENNLMACETCECYEDDEIYKHMLSHTLNTVAINYPNIKLYLFDRYKEFFKINEFDMDRFITILDTPVENITDTDEVIQLLKQFTSTLADILNCIKIKVDLDEIH